MAENILQLQQLSAAASGARALRGVSVQHNGESSAEGKQVLLNPPTDLSLMSSNQSSLSMLYCFLAAEESESFRKDVMHSGWNFAAKAHANANAWGLRFFNAGASTKIRKQHHKEMEESLSRKASQAWIIHCLYIPMKCFQIPRSSMTLCGDALARARKIKDETDADVFLDAYNTHLSESLYHLGGVFLREVTVKCRGQTTLRDLKNQAEKEINGSAELNLLGLQLTASAGGAYTQSRDATSKHSSTVKLESATQKVIALGPTMATNEEEFLAKLKEDHLSWAIIDKEADGKGSLISVWELLLCHAESIGTSPELDAIRYKTAAKLLCERWLKINRQEMRSSHHGLGEKNPFYDQLDLESGHFLSNLSKDPIFRKDKQPILPAPPAPLPLPAGSRSTTPKALSAGSHARTTEVDPTDVEGVQNTPAGAAKAISLPESAWMQIGDKMVANAATEGSSDSDQPGSAFQYRYVGDLLVDRQFCLSESSWPQNGADAGCRPFHKLHQAPKEFIRAAAHRFIDCLRHRLDPYWHLLQLEGGAPVDDWDTEEEDSDTASMAQADEEGPLGGQLQQHRTVCPLALLIHIFQSSDVPMQIALCSLLLSQRCATLLVFPSVNRPVQLEGAAVSPPLQTRVHHCMEALGLVDVSLEEEEKICIADDTTRPRLVFLSNKSVQESHAAIVASRVLNCDFVSKHGQREKAQLDNWSPVVEVGVGFVSNTLAKLPSQHYLSCLAFHVTGPYQQFAGFITAIADVIVLELEQGESHMQDQLETTSKARVLRWQESEVTECSDKKNKLVRGQESYLAEEISRFLSSAMKKPDVQKSSSARESLRAVCSKQFPMCQLARSFEKPQKVLDQCDFVNMRESLKLQSSFILEAQACFELSQCKDNPGEMEKRHRKCDQERANRLRLAKDVMENPLMRLFYQLLNEHGATSRIVQVMWLQKTLSGKMCEVLEESARRVSTTLQAYNRNSKDTLAKLEYLKAKQVHVRKSLGMDNLWREMCHIFEADTHNQRGLAQKAAQHLLDGFPLEMLDGDAGIFCDTWVNTVLAELDIMTSNPQPARIFVLSAMGLQSSGKSTILNLMFGAKLQSSAGRCTRGVFMQLVPSQWPQFDYVMLLDTEGLRSSEFFGLESSEMRDNRLATLGLLPADASIFMVSNEDDSGLKEVLPMVLLAFKGSKMAENCGGCIKSKMVFVYRSVNTNDSKKLMENKQTLYRYLQEAAEQVANKGASSTGQDVAVANYNAGVSSASRESDANGDLLKTLFIDLRVHEEEVESDVKCMGGLTNGCEPPSDTPDWHYGERVVELRNYINERVIADGWVSRGLKEWADHLGLVWDCIKTADFELSFKSQMEYRAYLALQKELEPLRTEILQKHMDEFERLEETVKSKGSDEKNITAEGLIRILETNVEDLVDCKSKKVQSFLAMKKWAKWKAKEESNWGLFCATTKASYRMRLADMASGILGFQTVVTNYEERIKREILRKMDSGEWKTEQSKESKVQIFNEIFESILKEAEKAHPPFATQVPQMVMDRYTQAGLTERYSMLASEQPAENGAGNKHKEGSSKHWLTWDSWRSWPKWSKNPIGESNFSSLQTMIDRQLRDARQFSEIIVDNVIRQTVKDIEGKGQGREEARNAHLWVKKSVIERMVEVQKQWDQDHNVAEKLRCKAKPRLYAFFEARADGLGVAASLIKELQSFLEGELEEAHTRRVVRKVTGKVARAHWVLDWGVMRKFLDYHLLTLMEAEKSKDQLLDYVSNGSLHYENMKNVLIEDAVGGSRIVEEEWDDILRSVESCLTEQCSMGGDRLVAGFVNDLARGLATAVDAEVGSSVSKSFGNKHCYELEHVLEADFLKREVQGLCERLRNTPLHKDKRTQISKGVNVRMADLHDDSCRPRCELACPRCGSTCFHSAGHSTPQQHDCIHQPAGLTGSDWLGSGELVERTCLEMLETNCNMILDGDKRRRPYSEFEVEYPCWNRPATIDKTALLVRECIFFHCQKELSGRHKRKPCPSHVMPARFNHNPTKLRTDLHNKLLGTVFRSEDEHKHFLDLLKRL